MRSAVRWPDAPVPDLGSAVERVAAYDAGQKEVRSMQGARHAMSLVERSRSELVFLCDEADCGRRLMIDARDARLVVIDPGDRTARCTTAGRAGSPCVTAGPRRDDERARGAATRTEARRWAWPVGRAHRCGCSEPSSAHGGGDLGEGRQVVSAATPAITTTMR